MSLILALVMLSGAIGKTVPGALAQSDPCPEPNDVQATACDLSSGSTIQGVIETPDDVDTYRVVVSTGDRIQIDLTDLPVDYDLYLADSSGAVMGQSVKEGLAAERIQLTVQPGTYYVFVRADPSREVDASRPYTLTMTLAGAAAAQAAPPAPTSTAVPPTPVPPPPTAVPAQQPFYVGDFRFSYGDINTDFVGSGGSLPYRRDTPLRMAFQYRGAKAGAKFRYEIPATDKYGIFGKPRGEFPANANGQGYPIITVGFSTDAEKYSIEFVIYYEDREVGRGSLSVG